jgi:hypothetical protein
MKQPSKNKPTSNQLEILDFYGNPAGDGMYIAVMKPNGPKQGL